MAKLRSFTATCVVRVTKEALSGDRPAGQIAATHKANPSPGQPVEAQ